MRINENSPRKWQKTHSFSLILMFDITSSKKTTPKQIRFTRNTDWELFRQHLESKMNQYTDQDINLTTTIHLDQACQDLTDHIMSAFELACPITYISNTIRKPPWLTPEIEAAQRSIKPDPIRRTRSGKTLETVTSLTINSLITPGNESGDHSVKIRNPSRNLPE